MSPGRWFRDLPLFWKLLVPFVALLLIVGAVGGVVVVRGLAADARTRLEADLLRSSLDARSALQARELYLLESANLAANLDGMPAAVAAGDAAEVDRLLQTVLALKGELTLVGVLDADRGTVVAYTDGALGGLPTGVADADVVGAALASTDAGRHAGVVGEDPTIVVAAPVCDVLDGCVPTGVALVGLRVDRLVVELAAAVDGPTDEVGLALFAADGRRLGASGLAPSSASGVDVVPGRVLRQSETVDDVAVQVLYAPFQLQGQPQGLLAVTLPADVALAGVRSATTRLLAVLLLTLLGIVGVGALVSRLVTARLGPVLATNARLGAGELAARAPVDGEDEIGALARGLNAMADELQASHDTLESRVEQRTAEVRRLLDQRTRFFASLSHELRTPLAIILSEAELLRGSVAQADAESVAAIESTAATLLDSVNDILDVARAEADALQLDLAPLDLASLLVGVRPTAAGLAGRGGLAFEAEIPSDCGVVVGDEVRLREVVLNLVDNAVKYTPGGGRVRLGCRPEGDEVVVEVRDSGIGIPPEIGDDLFEPFFTVPGARPVNGQPSSGLGMALSRQLVVAHGGSMTYESAPGEGTTFTVRLPLVPSDDAADVVST